MTTIKKEPGQLNKYQLTPQQEVQAKLLGPETLAYYEHQATLIAEQLIATRFSGDPVIREEQIMQFVFLQSKRETLLELLTDTQAEFERLASADA